MRRGGAAESSTPALHAVQRSEHEPAGKQSPHNRDDRGAFDGRQRSDDRARRRRREGEDDVGHEVALPSPTLPGRNNPRRAQAPPCIACMFCMTCCSTAAIFFRTELEIFRAGLGTLEMSRGYIEGIARSQALLPAVDREGNASLHHIAPVRTGAFVVG